MAFFIKQDALKSAEARFWAKVRKTDGCWEWTASKNRKGYGRFRIGGQTINAHRYAYELAHGPIPAGMHVLHHCDVRNCVNFSHLFLGTNAENVADRNAKGRQARNRGEKSGSARLTEELVREIRASNETQVVIAKRLGVHQTTVSLIRLRKKWKHVEAA